MRTPRVVLLSAIIQALLVVPAPGIPAVWLLLYEPNSEWRLDSATLQKELLPASVNGTFYPFIHIVLRLSRHSLYFVLNTLVPCIVITLLSMLVYLLPSESGEKVTLAITVLLSYTVLLLFVSDVSPRNGDSVPLLSESRSHPLSNPQLVCEEIMRSRKFIFVLKREI